jgi:hypothetical protein
MTSKISLLWPIQNDRMFVGTFKNRQIYKFIEAISFSCSLTTKIRKNYINSDKN